MPAKFELKQSKGGRYMWNLHASNGEVILTSQQYKSKSSAKKGISSVQVCASSDNLFERRKAKNGDGYFVLKARNGRVVGSSEQYKSNRALENGIKSVCKNAPGASTKDLTG